MKHLYLLNHYLPEEHDDWTETREFASDLDAINYARKTSKHDDYVDEIHIHLGVDNNVLIPFKNNVV